MSLRYRILGIPKTAEDFADREKKIYFSNNLTLGIMRLKDHLEYNVTPIITRLYADIYIVSNDGNRKLRVKKYVKNFASFEEDSSALGDFEKMVEDYMNKVLSNLERLNFSVQTTEFRPGMDMQPITGKFDW